MRVCIPVTADGQIDPRWGRAARVAIADVRDGSVQQWEEHDVRWDQLHDEGTEGSHHARVARFLMEHKVQAVVTNHMGAGMQQMLQRMGIAVRLGAAGDPRAAVAGAA